MAAERFAHRRHDAQLAAPVRERPALRRFRGIARLRRPQIEARLQAFEHLAPRHNHFLEPGAAGIQRHELDESAMQAVFPRELRQCFNFVIVDVADNDRVDLDRVKSEFRAKAIPASTSFSASWPVIFWKFKRSSESRLKEMRRRPASRNARALAANIKPLVVIARSLMPGMRMMRATSSSASCRKSGSPPVSRTLLMPRSTARRTTCSISSKVRMFDRDYHRCAMGAGSGSCAQWP